MDVYIFSDEVRDSLIYLGWGVRSSTKRPLVRLLKHKDSMERGKAEFTGEKKRVRFFLMDQTYSRIMQ